MREIIDKKESLTDFVRENRGYRRPAINLKTLAIKKVKYYSVGIAPEFPPPTPCQSATMLTI